MQARSLGSRMHDGGDAFLHVPTCSRHGELMAFPSFTKHAGLLEFGFPRSLFYFIFIFIFFFTTNADWRLRGGVARDAESETPTGVGATHVTAPVLKH